MSIKNLELFQKRIAVRALNSKDFEQLVELQLKCFPGMKPWTKEQFESQLQIFSEGQICVEYRGKIIASSSSLIIDFDIYGEEHNWQDISNKGLITNHNPEGDTLYGIEIMVHPRYRGMKLARRLYNARKELARQYNLMRIVIGGRLPGYYEYKDKMTVEEYVDKVTHKALFDPVLTTQTSNGFVLKRLLPSYMESDKESGGYATLLEWTNLNYSPHPRKRWHVSRPVRICVVQYRMRAIDNFQEFGNQCTYFVDVASGYKSDFVLFPELLTTQLLSFVDNKQPGLAARELANFTDDYLELFSSLAVKYNINIVGGSHFINENDRLYNVSFLFKRNGEIGKQYKIHITPNERKWWGVVPGDKIEVFDTDVGKIAIQICYDAEFPELSRIAVEKGAQIIFIPFCTDERKGYLRVRYCAQARCIENQVYVAMAGTVGNLPQVENMDIQYAQSGILTPSDFAFARDGIAAECTPNTETVVIHDVDLEVLKRSRKSGTTLNWNDRRSDLYEVVLKK
ncbi:MAG: GNAT family N-acetyltransferase [Melioribacteraceae bacterium]|nr:GNAT family N-acetyltransferase [Melioribacteraceae bacterium]